MLRVKRMQDVIGPRNRVGTPGAASSAEIATRLARLDHQRLLLERQYAMWSDKKEAARRRIAALANQIAELERQMGLARPHSQKGPALNTTSRPQDIAAGPPIAAVSITLPTASRSREIPFEY